MPEKLVIESPSVWVSGDGERGGLIMPHPEQSWELSKKSCTWRLHLKGEQGIISRLSNAANKWIGTLEATGEPVELMTCDSVGRSTSIPTEFSAPNVLPIERSRLVPHAMHGNCSLIVHRGRRLLAYRIGFSGASFALAQLGADFQAVSNRRPRVNLFVPNVESIEDPRLFSFRSVLHCAFTVKAGGRFSQWYGAFDENYDIPKPVLLRPHRLGRHEKNWQFFEYDGRLFSVYAIAPHTVLEITGDRGVLFAETPVQPQWRFGEPRGGTPPVKRGKEFFSFFHSSFPVEGRAYYVAGAYAFSSTPPFRITRMSIRPILAPDIFSQPNAFVTPAVFPCGAILRGDEWIVSFGEWDWHCKLAFFSHEKLLQSMETFF